jgi:hypothetical protein
MFPGFFIGTVFLFMLVRTLVWGHPYRWHAYGHRWRWRARPFEGPSVWLWGDDDPSPETRPSWRHRDVEVTTPSEGLEGAVERFLASVRHGLGASATQEKAFAAAVARLRDVTADFRARVNEARDEAARAVRGDAFDDLAFEDASHSLDAAVQAMRAAFRDALVRVHDVLDSRQRAILADVIAPPRPR